MTDYSPGLGYTENNDSNMSYLSRVPKLLVGRYRHFSKIGSGGFGTVNDYVDLVTQEHVAIKTIPSKIIEQETRRVIREIDIMSFINGHHPHLISYHALFVTKKGEGDQCPESMNVLSAPYNGLSVEEKKIKHFEELKAYDSAITVKEEYDLHIVMDLMRGDLHFFINVIKDPLRQKSIRIPDNNFLVTAACVFMFQLAFALDFLHRCDIVHRDIKPDNVLLKLDLNNAYSSVAVLADLGLARDTVESTTFYICTRYYRPPEVVTNCIADQPKIDIWSVGCVLYEVATCQTLFNLDSALNSQGTWDGKRASGQLEVILDIVGCPPKDEVEKYMPEGNAKLYLLRSDCRASQVRNLLNKKWKLPCSAEVRELWTDLMLQCLEFFPQKRPSAKEVCQHGLFRHFNMLYGDNIPLFETKKYVSTYAEDRLDYALKSQTMGAVLDLVKHSITLMQKKAEAELHSEGDHVPRRETGREMSGGTSGKSKRIPSSTMPNKKKKADNADKEESSSSSSEDSDSSDSDSATKDYAGVSGVIIEEDDDDEQNGIAESNYHLPAAPNHHNKNKNNASTTLNHQNESSMMAPGYTVTAVEEEDDDDEEETLFRNAQPSIFHLGDEVQKMKAANGQPNKHNDTNSNSNNNNKKETSSGPRVSPRAPTTRSKPATNDTNGTGTEQRRLSDLADYFDYFSDGSFRSVSSAQAKHNNNNKASPQTKTNGNTTNNNNNENVNNYTGPAVSPAQVDNLYRISSAFMFGADDVSNDNNNNNNNSTKNNNNHENDNFPDIQDPALIKKYRPVDRKNSKEVQGAIESVLAEMTKSIHNSQRAEELRQLLTYFHGLQ